MAAHSSSQEDHLLTATQAQPPGAVGFERAVLACSPYKDSAAAANTRQAAERLQALSTTDSPVVGWQLIGIETAEQLADLPWAEQQSLLHWACRLGHAAAVGWAIHKAGCDPLEKDGKGVLYGRTALHHACRFGQLAVVTLLVDHPGVSLAHRDGLGHNALHLACMSGNVDLVAWLLDHAVGQVGETPEQGTSGNDESRPAAASAAVSSPSKHVTGEGADVSSSPSRRLPRWKKSASSSDQEAAGTISVDDERAHGLSPLDCAAYAGHLPVVELLVQRGADPAHTSHNGNVSLHWAADNDMFEVFEWLASNTHVPLEACNAGGQTPLDLAPVEQLPLFSSLVERVRFERARVALDRDEGPGPVSRAKLVVLGPIGVGKTTLIESLTRPPIRRSWLQRLGDAVWQPQPQRPATASQQSRGGGGADEDASTSQRHGSDTHTGSGTTLTTRNSSSRNPTIGVNMDVISLPGSRECAVLDMGGHPEFLVTHELVLTGRGLFLVVMSLATPVHRREANFKFWTTFLASSQPHVRRSSDAKADSESLPQVVVVLTNRDRPFRDGRLDVCKEENGPWFSPWGDVMLSQAREDFKGRLAFHDHAFVVNALPDHAETLDELTQHLCSAHDTLLATAPRVPRIMTKVVQQLEALRATHEEWPILTQHAFCEHLCDINAAFRQTLLFQNCLTYLEGVGEIVWLRQAYVVLTPEFLTSNVLGAVLAPAHIGGQVQADAQAGDQRQEGDDGLGEAAARLHAVHGIVRKEQLEAVFKNNGDMVAELLCELNLGCEYAPGELLLPSLLAAAGIPSQTWSPRQGARAYGRRYVCMSEVTCFSPGLFPRVQAACWASPCHRDNQIWFGGFSAIATAMGGTAEATLVVTMTQDRRSVDVCAWSTNENALAACHEVVERVARWVAQAQQVCCSGTQTTTFALSPSQLTQDPPPWTTSTVHGFPLADVQARQHDDRVRNPDTSASDSAAELLGLVVLRVLIVRANSRPYKEPVNTDKEERVIRQALECRPRCVAKVDSIGFATLPQLKAKLAEFKPDWVHYVGHTGNVSDGSQQSGAPRRALMLVGNDGEPRLLHPQELADLLQEQQPRITGLVLNACHSTDLFEAATLHVDVVIGGDGVIDDRLGSAFATTFWGHMFGGGTLQHCFVRAGDHVTTLDEQLPPEKRLNFVYRMAGFSLQRLQLRTLCSQWPRQCLTSELAAEPRPGGDATTATTPLEQAPNAFFP
eukprot:m.254420 g.254420  ORF g.254420 m.254420 type:complete len:1225 (-) comp19147_c0_seq1:116-3790(-)